MSYPVEGNHLICLVKGHIPCYCSCEDDSRCCGCDLPRVGKIYLHCLACATDLGHFVEASNEFPRCPTRANYEGIREEYTDKIRKHLTKLKKVNL